jgi:hypothetical protein
VRCARTSCSTGDRLPTIAALACRSEIDRFDDDHRRINAALRALIERVLECELELADRCLEACWLAIRDHERREEALLGALDSVERARTL